MIVKYTLMVLFIVILTALVVGTAIYYTIKTEVQYTLPDVAEQSITASVIFANVNKFLISTLSVLIIIVVVISLFIVGKITKPEYRLSQYLKNLAANDLTFEVEQVRGEELGDLIRRVKDVKETLIQTITEEKKLLNTLLVTTGNLLRELENPKPNREKLNEFSKQLLSNLEQLQIITTRYKL